MKLEAVIFDLDGVIVHTDMYHYQAWKKLADSLHIPFDETINNRLRGVSRMESLEIILERYTGPALSPEQKTEMASQKNAYYRESLQQLTHQDVSKEVLETLAAIRHRGYKQAIGYSSKNARFILERVGLLDWFDAISDGNNITHSKPHPEVFEKAAEYLGIGYDKCLVVEDAFAGIDAGKAAGMATAGMGDAAKYTAADYRITHFGELLEILQ